MNLGTLLNSSGKLLVVSTGNHPPRSRRGHDDCLRVLVLKTLSCVESVSSLMSLSVYPAEKLSNIPGLQAVYFCPECP